MSPPLAELEEEGKSDITLLAFPSSMESKCQTGSGLRAHNYMGLSDCSSVDSSTISTKSDGNNESLNLRATELRLGLPGSQSPPREQKHCQLSLEIPNAKTLFPLRPSNDNNYSLSMKAAVSGSKRGFSDAMDGFSEGKYADNSQVNALLSPKATPNFCGKAGAANSNSGTQPARMKEVAPCGTNGLSNSSSAPATKAQVVGWPPIRSFRKNTLTPLPKKADALFVKVSMDGAPYLRKVDLRTYSAYQELSSALEKLFSCFTIGQCGTPGTPGKEMLSESKLKDLLNGSEYVLTYEDKDNDWMLVGDVPWEMFIDTCKRLRIMKSCDAIGLAPRAVDKLASKN